MKDYASISVRAKSASLLRGWYVPTCSVPTWSQPTLKWPRTRSVNKRLRNGLRLLSETMIMKRGEAWGGNFDPSVGGEIQKRRPAVIISNDASNRFMN